MVSAAHGLTVVTGLRDNSKQGNVSDKRKDKMNYGLKSEWVWSLDNSVDEKEDRAKVKCKDDEVRKCFSCSDQRQYSLFSTEHAFIGWSWAKAPIVMVKQVNICTVRLF